MGINMNSSLLMSNANSQFRIPLYEASYIDSFYISSLNAIREMNESVREMHLDLYKLSGAEFVNEANMLVTFAEKINNIIKNIITIIKKAKDEIIAAIKRQTLKFKAIKHGIKNPEKLKAKINKYYESPDYIEASIYSNDLKVELTDANIPSADMVLNDRDFDNILNTANYHLKNVAGLTQEQIKIQLQEYTNRWTDERIKRRQELIGIKSITADDLNNFVEFKNQLTNYYIGAVSNRKVDREMTCRAIDNITKYPEIIASFDKTKIDIEKKYDKLSKRLDTFRKSINDIIANKSTVATNLGWDGSATPNNLKRENQVIIIAGQAMVLHNVINDIIQDHMTAYMVKLDCLHKMYNQDIKLVSDVKNKINAKFGVTESGIDEDMDSVSIATLEQSEYNYMQSEVEKFCEGCFLIHEMMANEEFVNTCYSFALLEDAGDTKNPVQRVIDMIVNMFNKFLTTINTITNSKDKPWFDKIEKTVMSAEFKFPAQDQNMEDWKPFRVDLLEKTLDVPVFDPSNNQLMDALADDETFAKFIYQKMGGNENDIKDQDAKNGNFTTKCKAIYSGGGGNGIQIKVSQLQTDKDKFFNYCKEFLTGENGGIYQSIKKDTQDLDRSKKNVDRALSELSKDIKKGNTSTENKPNTEKSSETNTQQPKDATTGADKTATTNPQTTKEESYDTTLDIANLFGLNEGYSVLNELKAPDVPADDREAVKKVAGGVVGGDQNKVKELQAKANRFFTMMGNALGAKMTVSMEAYRQYKDLFRWALKGTNAQAPTGNEEAKEEGIEAAAKNKEKK